MTDFLHHGRKGHLTLHAPVRLWTQQTYATIREHMPPNKQFYQDWDADRFLKWSRQYGPETVKVVTSILDSSPIVQQTFKACLGVMSMAKKYSAVRLERACKLACQRSKTPTYRMVKDILTKEEDLASGPLPTQEERPVSVMRGHQRGASYYGGGRHVES